MIGTRGFVVWISLLLAGSAALIGGCNDPVSSRAAAVRLQRIREHFDRFEVHEAEGGRRVRESIELAERLERWHAEHLRLSCDRVAKWWQHDVDRWANRAEYQRRIERQLEGDWPKAEWAAHKMFD